jgi:DNA polymerase-3 subunit delta
LTGQTQKGSVGRQPAASQPCISIYRWSNARSCRAGWARDWRRRSKAPNRECLDFIADRVEGNLLAAHQEIQKLALLYPEGQLSFEQIQDAVLNVARYDVFKLNEAMLTGDAARLVRMLEGLKGEGEALPLVLWAVAEEIRTFAETESRRRARQIR